MDEKSKPIIKRIIGFVASRVQHSTQSARQYRRTAVQLGDKLATVQQAFHTHQPTVVWDDFSRGGEALELPERGVTVYFYVTGEVINIRLEAPFSGVVSGVRIGDSLSSVVSILGLPIEKDRIKFDDSERKTTAIVKIRQFGQGFDPMLIGDKTRHHFKDQNRSLWIDVDEQQKVEAITIARVKSGAVNKTSNGRESVTTYMP